MQTREITCTAHCGSARCLRFAHSLSCRAPAGRVRAHAHGHISCNISKMSDEQVSDERRASNCQLLSVTRSCYLLLERRWTSKYIRASGCLGKRLSREPGDRTRAFFNAIFKTLFKPLFNGYSIAIRCVFLASLLPRGSELAFLFRSLIKLSPPPQQCVIIGATRGESAWSFPHLISA